MSVITVTAGDLEYLRAENITVPHCFTTRLGGVSTGIYDSLNLSMSQGDDPDNVLENYRRIGVQLGFTPNDVVNARQIHSDTVILAGPAHRGSLTARESAPVGDALITKEPGLALFVSTADCTPILLQDPVTGAVGAAHAGWRGTASAIAAKTVQAMISHFGCDPANIRAAIGPNAGVCHFETDADVPETLAGSLGSWIWNAVYPTGRKYYVNLKEINAELLRQEGVADIAISDCCTMCRPDRFWSHRVTRGHRGSQGAIILCKEVTP